MAKPRRADHVVAGPTKNSQTRLDELNGRGDECVRAWLIGVVEDLSLREVGSLRLEVTVDGFLEIFAFVVNAARTKLEPGSGTASEEPYPRMGALLRASLGGDADGARAVAALRRLQGLLERELSGSSSDARAPVVDPVADAVAGVCERLKAAAVVESG